MQKSLTWILLAAALGVFGFIYFFEQRLPSARDRAEAPRLFPDVEPAKATEVKVTFASGEILRAEKMDERWILREPTYPAQQTAIENFVTNVASIRKLERIAPHEVALQGAKAFGLEPPGGAVELLSGTNRYSFQIGGRAPLTSNSYARLQPSGEVVLASSEVGDLIPPSVRAWRDPRLVDFGALTFDQLRIRTGTRVFELAKDPTNRTWRIARPVPARADQERIAGLLEALRSARVHRYVADAPGDLERFGLQHPVMALSFLNGTNQRQAIEFGAALTNEPGLIHARLVGHGNVVAIPRQLADLLSQPYKNFHEAQLVSFQPAALDRVVIDSTEKFALQREPDGRWSGKGGADRVPIDSMLLNRFLTDFLALEILDIAREVPTDADLKSFGLLNPAASYAFFEQLTNAAGIMTNILFSEVSFGTNQSDRIYARRSDELPVYMASLAQMLALPRRVFELRDRRVWEIPASTIVRVSLSNDAGTNSLERTASGTWSEDVILHEAISEAVLRLAALEAVEWSSKGEQRMATFGMRENSPRLMIETRGVEGTSIVSVRFGNATMKRNIYAATTLPGDSEPVIFEFPGILFHSLIQLLPFPK
jgi:hypothetical protein